MKFGTFQINVEFAKKLNESKFHEMVSGKDLGEFTKESAWLEIEKLKPVEKIKPKQLDESQEK